MRGGGLKHEIFFQIAKVISKYMKIDTGNMDIQISKTKSLGKRGIRTPVLSASIPILDLNKQS